MSEPKPLTEPQSLTLPSRDILIAIVDRLNESARRQFLNELLEALTEAADKNDLAPVDELVDVWASSVIDTDRSDDGELIASA